MFRRDSWHAGMRPHTFKLPSRSLPVPSLKFTPPTRPFLTSITKVFGDASLKILEKTANNAPNDPNVQLEFLRNLGKKYPDAVVRRFSDPRFSINEACVLEYVTALESTNRGHLIDVKSILARMGPSAEQTLATVSHRLPQTAGAIEEALTTAARKSGATSSAPPPHGFPQQGYYAPPPPSSGQRVTDPLHVSLATTSNVRSQMWKTFRLLGATFIVVTAVGALMDEKGLGGKLSGGGSSVQQAEDVSVRFGDVLGVDEAKGELEEIVQYLREPEKFTRLGGKLPKGLLLMGPPGTGKTLLAKAIAGEAEVPFFYASGSQFEEVYVGVGARRVRDLFETAKKKAPCIIFIDEIDAIGGSRTLKDQSAMKMTLNELLVQMDGFAENNGVIVIGATNFKQSLDQALTRPGRFDKHVNVPLPDVQGRKQILELYGKKTIMGEDVDLNVLARGTPGMSGAELSNLVNQAAVKASMDGLASISHAVLEWAKDKILMGAERTTALITKETAKCTAYHEAGHALVAIMTEGANPIHKATIMPRGGSLGMVMQLPDGDQTSMSYKQMLARLDVCMGGRIAEGLIFGEENITSGASSDIQMASQMARAMVTKYGFSKDVGIVFHAGELGEHAAEETRVLIDKEVKRLCDESYTRATECLKKHSREHKRLAEALLEYETLTGKEVYDLVQKNVRPKKKKENNRGGAKGDETILGGKPAHILAKERARAA